jgi:hypothetical protein
MRWYPLQGPSLVVIYRTGRGVGRRDAAHLMRLSLRLANRRSYTYYVVPLVEGVSQMYSDHPYFVFISAPYRRGYVPYQH